MPNKIVIDNSPYYKRCAILIEDKLQEIHVMPQDEQSIEGNIFVGRVETISKGIDAAFVNIGKRSNAFLYVDETSRIKNGQPVIVQALRDASKGKGVYITTNISFSGTYTIIFPDGKNGHVGVSAKITDKNERKRLIDLVRPHVPKNCSVVIRTGAINCGDEIIHDLNSIASKMEHTLKYAHNVKPPALIYEEESFLEKIIRDTLCYGLSDIVVNNTETLNKIKPLADNLKMNIMVHGGNMMIFDHYRLESKMKELLQKRVWLKSGAFLIIDETEALVSIDVNTGKSKKQELLGETLYYSNIEAAREIPRQLRLRNLSGIIVVDFIDMKSQEKRNEIIEVLKDECLKDRNKTVVVGFTELGLALLTRKKTKEPLSRTLLLDCECIGGKRYSPDYIAFEIYMKIKKRIIHSDKKTVSVTVDEAIVNHLKRGIDDLKAQLGAEITTATHADGYNKYTVI